ncbi:hypothetical protein ACOMHN_041899 [Nucella lapillus]
MGCCDVESLRHSVCITTLLIAFAVSLAGVITPWWRVLELNNFSSIEGLWTECLRMGKLDNTCQFSSRNSGLWRAVQVVKATSVAVMFSAVLTLSVEALCPSPCCMAPRPRACCPTPSFLAALTASVLGFTGDLLYVGYSQYHSVAQEHEHLYYWSFALSVGGSCLALVAALAMGATIHVVWPREPAKKTPPWHWSNHAIFNPERQTQTSWLYIPSGIRYGGQLNNPLSRPYVISDASCRWSPYDSRQPYVGDPGYRGSDRFYVAGRDRQYDMYQLGPHLGSRSRPLSSARRQPYPDVAEADPPFYPGLEEMEMRMDYPSSEEYSGGELPSAPEDTLQRRFLSLPSSKDTTLPEYSLRGRESRQGESESEPAQRATASSGDPSMLPASDSAALDGRARSEQQESESAAPHPPPEAVILAEVTRSDVSTQTHPKNPFRTDSTSASASSNSRSTYPLRVQFEDQRDSSSDQPTWGTTSHTLTPEHTFRPVRESRHESQHDSQRPGGYTRPQIPSRARDHGLARRDYSSRRQEEEEALEGVSGQAGTMEMTLPFPSHHTESRQMEATEMTAAFPRQRADSPQTEDTDRAVAFQRQRPALKLARHPPLRPRPSSSSMPEFDDEQDRRAVSRRPCQHRDVVKMNRSRGYDYYRFDEVY